MYRAVSLHVSGITEDESAERGALGRRPFITITPAIIGKLSIRATFWSLGFGCRPTGAAAAVPKTQETSSPKLFEPSNHSLQISSLQINSVSVGCWLRSLNSSRKMLKFFVEKELKYF